MDAEPLTPIQRRLAAKFPPPSRYFRWIGDLTPGRVVIYARESSRWQDANGNLRCQIALLRRQLKKLGFTVIKVFQEAASGQRHERPLLKRAAAYAQRHNAVLVSEAVNRYVRSQYFHTQLHPKSSLHVEELERISHIGGTAMLATFLHPDTPESEVRSYQTRRGLGERARANRPAGYKKVRREQMLARVLRLHGLGYSYRELAGLLEIPRETISRWVKLKNGTPEKKRC